MLSYSVFYSIQRKLNAVSTGTRDWAMYKLVGINKDFKQLLKNLEISEYQQQMIKWWCVSDKCVEDYLVTDELSDLC